VCRAEQGLAGAVRKGQGTGQFLGPVHPGPARTRTEIYAMTDGVSDEEFEQALAEAKAEGNLSRVNVLRKLRQRHTPAAAPGQARRPDSN
jgi:hypothetical protein